MSGTTNYYANKYLGNIDQPECVHHWHHDYLLCKITHNPDIEIERCCLCQLERRVEPKPDYRGFEPYSPKNVRTGQLESQCIICHKNPSKRELGNMCENCWKIILKEHNLEMKIADKELQGYRKRKELKNEKPIG